MIEFSCTQCGKQLKVKDEAAGKKGKCPQCGTLLHVPHAASEPVVETVPERPRNFDNAETSTPSVNDAGTHSEPSHLHKTSNHESTGLTGIEWEQPLKIAIGAGGLGLVILAISPLFKWVNFGAGGVTGISGDGKIVLGVTVVSIILYAAAVFTRKRLIAVSLGVGAWGTISLFWMGGLIWKVGSIFDSLEVKDNPFAAIFATQVSPGAGLYLGLIGGLITATTLSYLAVQHLRQRNRLWPFYAVQLGAVAVGVLVAIAVGPQQPSRSSSEASNQGSLLSSTTDAPRSERTMPFGGGVESSGQRPKDGELSQVDLATKRAYAEKVVLRDIHVGESVLGEQGVFGEIKNVGDRTLSEVEITVYCLDAQGQPISENTFHPVHEGASGWSTRSYMPLRPHYAQGFGYKVESTSDWSGRVRVEVTDLAFADGADTQIPAQSDPQKRAYIPNIELRDVRKGESTLGEAGVFGEVKNAGQRTLTEVEIIIYCLDDAGHRVFEKHYHPVLVSESSWSMDPDTPLKPNYTEKFGCKMDDAPSDWSGKVEVMVYDIGFAD
jgi:hypothetical protein